MVLIVPDIIIFYSALYSFKLSLICSTRRLSCRKSSRGGDAVSIHHICIDSLVPSVKKINIGNPGIQVNYGGGGGGGKPPPPINFAGYLDFQYWFLCTWEPAN